MSMLTDTRSLASAYSDMCLSTPYEAGIPSSAKLRATRASYDSSMRIGLDLVRLTLRVACGPRTGAGLSAFARPLTGRTDRFTRLSDSGPLTASGMSVSKAIDRVIVYHAHRLHESVADRRPNEFEASP